MRILRKAKRGRPTPCDGHGGVGTFVGARASALAQGGDGFCDIYHRAHKQVTIWVGVGVGRNPL